MKRSDAKAIADQLGIPLKVVLAYVKDANGDRWNIAPREKMPPPIVYKPEAGGPVTLADSMPWGITLPGPLLINAKMESAKFHGKNLTQRRCLIPAHGFYEWFAINPKSKVPHVLRLPDDELFFFAGLWGPHPKRVEGFGEHGFVIMTGEPAEDVAWLHNRMPLVVPPGCYDMWLNEDMKLAEVCTLLSEEVLEYTWGLPWIIEPITPLPSGKGAGDIPQPTVLPPVPGTPLATNALSLS